MAQIDELFKVMVAQSASDLHLSAGSSPFLRIHGSMVKLDHKPLDNKGVQALVFEILSDKQKRTFIENWELDTSYAIKGLGRFRVNVFMQRRGMGAVFRVIPTELKSMEELGLPKQLYQLIDVPRGLILVTGPTGSGKSTTLAAMIHTINQTKKEHIMTIEDPIEFVHENQMSLVNQREVNSHTKSFAKALKAALREDPDIILVGEMRDLETISLAMTAAETGHLVFGTLHTNSAAKTVDRIIDVFPDTQQAQVRVMLAESLRGVVAQTLFPRHDKPGRVAGIEVLMNTSAISNLIREGKTYQIPSAMQTGSKLGMITFEQSLGKLVREGKLDQTIADNFLGRKKADDDDDAPSEEGNVSNIGQKQRPGANPAAGGNAPVRGGAAASEGGGGIRIYNDDNDSAAKKVGSFFKRGGK
ncbi:MAG: type IV pili twitching motility protein PilT [Bdellovibrionaceae bacterium]|nr:type IV pili twitching motility protein PilT [Pseudobdellovibrionaceae bacterium]